MKKILNRILKFVGINVVKAKRTRVKKAGYRVHIPIEDAKTCVPSPTCCKEEYLAKQGRTPYIGDGCKPAHVDASPTQDNKVSGPTS